jgi:LAS seventeen-binding protein 5
VTVTVENLTSESYEEEDLSGIPELVEVITLQATGPSEAARAIRKKLKYGNVHRQIRALVILDGLIQNAGERFQRTFVDEPLLERLRVCGTSDLSDVAVRNKCRELFRSWSQYAGRPGLDSLARLHRVSHSHTGFQHQMLIIVGTTQEKASRHTREIESPQRDRGKSVCRRRTRGCGKGGP